MTIKSTNHYMNAADFINALQLPGRNYIEIDDVRLVVEDGTVHGWYNPNGPSECNCSAPSEGVSA